jgi:chorismate mutase
VQEAETRDSLAQTMRVLIHCYMDDDLTPCHVYQNGAEILRPDRSRINA